MLLNNNRQRYQNFGDGLINVDSQGSLLDVTNLYQTEMVANELNLGSVSGVN